jgi:hypothetical protein
MTKTNLKHCSARMTKSNPMHDAETRAKVSATLRAMKHKPALRGGNGAPMPVAQQVLAEFLGWPTEVIYTTYTGEPPWHYKLDIAHPTMKVCVEVDGLSHNTRDRHRADKKRDELLISRGWLVFRFSNQAVMERTEECAREVLSTTSKWKARTPIELEDQD